jgi:hypothetical protein
MQRQGQRLRAAANGKKVTGQRSEFTRAVRSLSFGAKEMAEESAGNEKDHAGCSAECRVQQPEVRCGHFFEKANVESAYALPPKVT